MPSLFLKKEEVLEVSEQNCCGRLVLEHNTVPEGVFLKWQRPQMQRREVCPAPTEWEAVDP